MFRDIKPHAINMHNSRAGRKIVAVIGIDRYQKWQRLNNAVNDARGTLHTFLRLGFEQFVAPLYDEAATADAIRSLVTDDLARLNKNDSLVLFFAGHGHTIIRTFQEGDSVKSGYIIPVDGDQPGGSTARWLRLDSWLSDVARLEVKHILVFLDACHSGIALGSLIKWRSTLDYRESIERLGRRRSRRVITSALDDQRAMDGGPIPGHSLFTGCLIDGLNGHIAQHGEFVTGSQIGLYLQDRVTSYPQSEQTPDFGALEENKRGELIIQVRTEQTTTLPSAQPPSLVVRMLANSQEEAFAADSRVRTPTRPPDREASTTPGKSAAMARAQLALMRHDETTSVWIKPERLNVGHGAAIASPRDRSEHVTQKQGPRSRRWIVVAGITIATTAIVLAIIELKIANFNQISTPPQAKLEDNPTKATFAPNVYSKDTPFPPMPTTSTSSVELVDAMIGTSAPDSTIEIRGTQLGPAPLTAKLEKGTPHAELVDSIIGSSTPDSTIEIVGTDQSGPAPLTAKLEKGKPYKVRMTAHGFETRTLDIKGGDTQQFDKLVLKPRVIIVNSDPPGALIFIDGAVVGGRLTPTEIQLFEAQAAKKSVRVKLSKRGWTPITRIVDLAKFAEDDARMVFKLDEKLRPP